MRLSFTLPRPNVIVRVMRHGFSFLIACTLMLAGCSGPRSHSLRPPVETLTAPEPYVRVANTDSNRVELQIAARRFIPGRRGQPVVWLTGVSHIGESNYYAALQIHLGAQTLVLFEGIGGSGQESATSRNENAHANNDARVEGMQSAGNRGSLQSSMAASLGLVFQLEAIDYRQANFRNSDLSIMQLRQLMTQAEVAAGKPSANESFDNLLELMAGNSWFDSLLQVAFRFLGANPKLQAFGRLALIDLLGQLQGDPARLQGLPPEMKQLLEVLLQRRNDKVIADLKSELPRIGRHGSIAIFFGTGHMPDLETRLRHELKYRPAQEMWFRAFDVDLVKSKISSSERAFIDGMVKLQLDELVSSRPGSK